MVMHARKTPRISDGYFEKHQAHPYQNSSKYSSKSTSNPQHLGQSSSSSSDHHRGSSFSDSSHHHSSSRLGRDSTPNNGTYHSHHHHHHRGGSSGGGGGGLESVSPLLDDVGGGRKSGRKEREIRDYKRDKYSDCSRSPKDSTTFSSSGGKPRSSSSRGISSSTSSSSTASASAGNLLNSGTSQELDNRSDRTNHDRLSSGPSMVVQVVDQQQQVLVDSGGVKKGNGGSSRERGGKQGGGGGSVSVHNNCLDKNISDSRHSSSNITNNSTTSTPNTAGQQQQQQQSTGGSNQQQQQQPTSRVGDWSEHLSSSGKRYYYNCKTEVSQWEKPREWLMMLDSREGGSGSRTERDRDRSDRGGYRDGRDRDRDRSGDGSGGGYSRGGSTRYTHDKHSNSRQSSSSSNTQQQSASCDQRQSSNSLTNNSSNSNTSSNTPISSSSSLSRSLSSGDKLQQQQHHRREHGSSEGGSAVTAAAASRDCSVAKMADGVGMMGGGKDRLGGRVKSSGGYTHQMVQQQQQEVAQDMDISPGDSTPTSETSPSNNPTITTISQQSVTNSTMPTTAVLLANALPRLTSHPIITTPCNSSTSSAVTGDLGTTAAATSLSSSDPTTLADLSCCGAMTTTDVNMVVLVDSGSGVLVQDGSATPTHSELTDGVRSASLVDPYHHQQQHMAVNGGTQGVVVIPGTALQAVIPISTQPQQSLTTVTVTTSSLITTLSASATSINNAVNRSAGASSSVGAGNHLLVTASLAHHVRDDLLVHVRGWPADIVERQAIKCAEEAALVGGVHCARVSAELKTARAIVRLTEIQATLQEQRILFLRQQIRMLEELKSQNSFMSDDT